ncbi:equilibrative nucleoside transporter 3 isoform X1 [Oncorhynchus keta]|uniref:equilibrative nucleoside transporter 3 isoform X1 n=2 Tax=Oncorhynchus keta TaxID=8018 RepID=UPI00227A3D20|nr:equilibrative nucleoside transporter 3 isoform X1 [Oncorhynchus keta]XP_052350911.1 equilibrative nucleoside transporter 3 isoform X1 [Oncorhynchus keta]
MMADGTESLQASVNSYWAASPIHASAMSDEETEGQDTDEIDRAPLLPKQQHAGPPGATGRPLASRHCPEDSYCMVYMIFFLLGIGSLLPWNFFITAKHYWTYKLSNNTDGHGEEPRSDLSEYFESYLAIASTVPSVLCLVLNYLLVNRLSPAVRILSSLLIILAVFIVTTVMVKVDSSGCREQFFFGTLASVAMVSGASNLFSGSVFGISGHFPMRISQALISGQAMGGTISAVASIVDLAAAKDVTDSALAYFLTADVFILFCILMYLLLPKLDYSRHYMLAAEYNKSGSIPEPRGEADGPEGAPASTVSYVSIPPLKPILQQTWLLGLCVFYVFFISIMVFPGVSSGIQSVNQKSGSPWTTTYFTPITSFFLYNVADFCGRQATAWLQVPGPTSRVLPALVLSRTVLVPLLMFCNYQPRDHLHTVLFSHDLFPVFFICLLGITNGYLGTLPMIYGPKVVPRDLAEPAGVVMSFFLTLGLAVGSAFSVLIVHFI